MKKKAIEKIPYLTAKKHSKRTTKYVAVAEVIDIAKEKHLFVEVYYNLNKELQVPIYRFVYTQNDWGNYQPDSENWSARSITDEYNRKIWNSEGNYVKESDTYMSEEDIRKIKNFSKIKIYNTQQWWQYLLGMESDIKYKRWQSKMQKRQDRLNERCENIPDIPEDFEKWYKEHLFKDTNHIYYKRKGRYATFWCSHCGGTYTYATKHKDTYEGQFEKVVVVPIRYARARCELCDTKAIYRPAGNMKNMYGIIKKCYIGQPYKETGAVIRYFEVEKILTIGKPESFICTEMARNYYEDKKDVVTDYYLYSHYSGNSAWYDHNIGGLGSQIKQDPGIIYPETHELLKGTLLQYSGVKEFEEYYDKVPLAAYMTVYRKRQYMEMLSKMGMYHIVRNLIEGGYEVEINDSASCPSELLGINNNKMKALKDCHGELDMLKVFRLEKELNQNWDMELCEKLRGMISNTNKIKIALEYMTLQQLINRVEKYSGVENGVGCSKAQANLRHIEGIYLDYLEMRQRAGYDLKNAIYQYPKNIVVAHENMVKEINEKELDIRLAEVKQKYPDIEKKYRSWRKIYFYEDENMVIRPAKSAEEIVLEGRTLHHCVGGDGYLGKHNRGDSIILLLRFKENKQSPYITVEIQGTRIVQWYGAGDKKPDKENMEKWIDNYVLWLKAKNTEMLLKATV